MSADVIDFGALESAATTAVENTETTEVETPAVAEGSEAAVDDAAGKGAEKKEGTEQKDATDKTEAPKIAEIRKALKDFKAANPDANTKIANELNNMASRVEAYEKAFGSAREATQIRAAFDTVGGLDGLTRLQENVAAIEASDAKLYSGDKSLISDIVEDLKSEGKIDALGKLAPAFLQEVMKNDPQAYRSTLGPILFSSLEKAGVPDHLESLVGALKSKDAAGVNRAVSAMVEWYNGLADTFGKAPQTEQENPAKEAWEKERDAERTGKRQAFETSLKADANKSTTDHVVKSLKPFLQTSAFLKELPMETKQDLARAIRSAVYAKLAGDGVTPKQMQLLSQQKSPDKTKITNYWNSRVAGVVDDVTKSVLKTRYPGYAKSGPTSKATGTPAGVSEDPKNPTKIAAKPEWNSLDWSKDPKELHYIMGRGYIKGRGWVSWKK